MNATIFSPGQNNVFDPIERLTINEAKAVQAVVAYMAYRNDISEPTVLAMLRTAFDFDDVKDIASEDYDAVIKFLVDTDFNMMMN